MGLGLCNPNLLIRLKNGFINTDQTLHSRIMRRIAYTFMFVHYTVSHINSELPKICGTVRTIRKCHSTALSRSRFYRPETRFTLCGHICACVLKGSLAIDSLLGNLRAGVHSWSLIKQDYFLTEFRIFYYRAEQFWCDLELPSVHRLIQSVRLSDFLSLCMPDTPLTSLSDCLFVCLFCSFVSATCKYEKVEIVRLVLVNRIHRFRCLTSKSTEMLKSL